MTTEAPGKSSRKGVPLKERFKRFPDDATAEVWFAARRWDGKQLKYQDLIA